MLIKFLKQVSSEASTSFERAVAVAGGGGRGAHVQRLVDGDGQEPSSNAWKNVEQNGEP